MKNNSTLNRQHANSPSGGEKGVKNKPTKVEKKMPVIGVWVWYVFVSMVFIGVMMIIVSMAWMGECFTRCACFIGHDYPSYYLLHYGGIVVIIIGIIGEHKC